MAFQKKERPSDKQGEEISPGIFEKFLHPNGWLRDRVVIRSQDGPSGNQPIYPQVNGYTIGIPREVETEIPRPFTEAIRNAVETIIEIDDKTGAETFRHVPRYHMEVKKEGVNFEELTAGKE